MIFCGTGRGTDGGAHDFSPFFRPQMNDPADILANFDFGPRPRIVFGVDAVDRIGSLAGELGGRRVLVVSDAGVVAAGHAPRAIEQLVAAGLETCLFDGVAENPTTEDIQRIMVAARDFQPDLLVGLGGGSSMDSAKGVNFLVSNGGRIQDYWGVGKATRPMLPMIAVPTTSGTGSETQSFALISDVKTHVKMACGDRKATCRVALLDPKLTLTQPPRVTAMTGIDALSHALETFVTKRRTAISLAFSREAWVLPEANFPRVLAAPYDLKARAGMQLGASLAGLAIENSMLGAAHALANPLTAHYRLPHGEAIGLMLPHVIRFNSPRVGEAYGELLGMVAGSNGAPAAKTGAAGLADFIASLVEKAGLPRSLSDRGIPRDQFPRLAAEAATQWTGQFNPRPLDQDELLRLYEAAH